MSPVTFQRLARIACALGLVACSALLSACGSVSMPKLPEIGKQESSEDFTATPRDMLSARLVNPRANADTPSMTVGKMIEFADRYLACDCAATRFVRAWEKTPTGYRLLTNSDVVRPIEFVCQEGTGERECFLVEIDRGPQSKSLAERFVPGSEFIQFLYDNGKQCEREEPCG